MRYKLGIAFLLLLSILAPLSCLAETLYLTSGEVIRGSVGEINDDGMMVTHDASIDFYSFDEVDSVTGLPPDKKEHYDRVSAPEYQQALNKARLTGETIQVGEDEQGAPIIETKGPSVARKEWQAQMQEIVAGKAFRYALIGVGILFAVVWMLASG